MKKNRTFQFSCVGCDNVGRLHKIIDNSRTISRSTFIRNVDNESRVSLEGQLGYGRTFPIKNDYHVSYHKSVVDGKKFYYLRWSAIEYVFY